MRKSAVALSTLLSLLAWTPALAATEVSGPIVSDTTWTAADSPYIVTGVSILPAATLTILPGTIVKVMRDGSPLHVSGTLIIGAPSGAPVVITSISDDSVGGDTNNDGSSTVPASGNWCSIMLNPGSRTTIENTTIRYGGAALNSYGWRTNCSLVKNDGGILSLNHVRIVHNESYGIQQLAGTTTITNSEIAHTVQYGIHVLDGTLSVNHSSIYDNLVYGIFNESMKVVDATNNWWGAFGGPTTYAGIISMGNLVSSRVDYSPWLLSPPVDETPGDPCAGVENCNSNVLFLPGLEASRLYWTDPNCLFLSCENQLWLANSDADAEKLYLNPMGSSILGNIYTSIIRGPLEEVPLPIAGTNIYKTFLKDLKSWRDDERIIRDFAVTPYDWRLSIDDVLEKGVRDGDKVFYGGAPGTYILDEFLRMASSSRTKKVTIIAHSNGGLVAKRLMLKLREMGREDLVDNLILVAVPQIGTPKAVGGLLHGTDLGISVFLDEMHARTLGENMPSGYALMPSQKYFDTVSYSSITSKLVTFTNSPLYANERARYGLLVSNMTELRGFLLGSEGRTEPADNDPDAPNVLKEGLLDQALMTHAQIDDWQPATSTRVIQIAGWGESTISGVSYYTEEKQDCRIVQNTYSIGSHEECGPYYEVKKYRPNFTTEGDGTVVVPSALWMSTSSPNVERYWVDLWKYNSATAGNIDRDHKNITEVQSLIELIKSKLTNASLPPLNYIATSTAALSEKLSTEYIYTLHSPLTLDLYDALGNHTGISTTSGMLEQNIPGSRYGTLGDVKYIIADAGVAQHLSLHGYATGTFSLDVERRRGDEVLASTTFASIPVSPSTVATFTMPPESDPTSATPLTVDIDGNGTVDRILTPNLGGTTYPDRNPPEVAFNFDLVTSDLVVRGVDAEGATVVTQSTSSIRIVDKGGNTLLIPFVKYREKPTRLKVVFNTLIYNDVPTSTPRATLDFEWELNKNGTLKLLTQDVRINGVRRIRAEYSGSTNQTKIVDRVKEGGEKSVTKSTKTDTQLVSISILKGVLEIAY